MHILNHSYFHNTEVVASENNHKNLSVLKNQSKDALKAYLAHQETEPSEIQEHLDNSSFYEAILLNPNATSKQIDKLLDSVGTSVSERIIQLAIKHRNISKTQILKFISSDNTAAWVAAVEDTRTPDVGLRYILNKTQSSELMVKIIDVLNSRNVFVPESLTIKKDKVVEHALKTSPIPEDAFAANFKKGRKEQLLLLQNPFTNPATLDVLASAMSEKELILIASNPACSEKTLSSLSTSNDVFLRRAVAANPNTPSASLRRLADDRNSEVVCDVVRNKNCPLEVLTYLSKSRYEHVRCAVASQNETPPCVLDCLVADKKESVRKACSLNANLSITSLKKLANDTCPSVSSRAANHSSFGAISSLEGFSLQIKEASEKAFLFYGLQSPKKTLKLLINSKHPTEVSFVFGSGQIESIEAISTLQSTFLNRQKMKLDKEGYLNFLSLINESLPPCKRLAFNSFPREIKACLKYFGPDFLISLAQQYSNDEAKDSIHMLGSLVSFENQSQNKKTVNEIESYLKGKNVDLHAYLSKKTIEVFGLRAGIFYQAQFLENKKEASEILDSGWEINWPTKSNELALIGTSQNHCVGGVYYAERCIDGSNVIFQIAPRGDMKHGYTFQFSTKGKLLQAKGFCNCSVPNSYIASAKKVFKTMMTAIAPSSNL